jgi:hypothetical protein
MRKATLFVAILAILGTFTFCDKEDADKPNPQGRYYKLYGKWWYNINSQGRGDHKFTMTDTTSGTFEVVNPPLPNYGGTYQWYASGDSMLIDVNGSTNVYVFKEIGDHSMKYSPSNESHNTYEFSDVKP